MPANHTDDTPPPSTIRIGKANVGLLGLEAALGKVLGEKTMSEDEAVAFLYETVSGQNYVPAEAVELYKDALRAVYLGRRRGKAASPDNALTIRVLGSGCVSCDKLTGMLIEALAKLNLAADMESVRELDEIWRHGVTSTPALVVNNKVKCAGRMPTPAEVEQWLREEGEAW